MSSSTTAAAAMMFVRFLSENDGVDDEHHDEDEHHEDEHHDDDDDDDGKPWGKAIGAAFAVQLITLSGLILVVLSAVLKRRAHMETVWKTLHETILPSFASGTLLATAVFLLIPESLIYLQDGGHGHGGHEEHSEEEHSEGEGEGEEEVDTHNEGDESAAAWKFGAALLGGFMIPIILSAIFRQPDITECEQCRQREFLESNRLSNAALERVVELSEEVTDYDNQDDTQQKNESTTMDMNCDNGECKCHNNNQDEEEQKTLAADDTTTKKKNDAGATTDIVPTNNIDHHPVNYSLALSICLGDVFHNFCDGIFLGTAFLLCSNSLAWTITATTIYHELAQEIADFALLTHHCGLSVIKALIANFLAGFSVMIGAIVVLVSDLSDTAIGVILTMSAGVYVYIAAVECIPRVQAVQKSFKDTLLFLICFISGAIPIGLVLLNHGHCEAGHDNEDSHNEEEHNHD